MQSISAMSAECGKTPGNKPQDSEQDFKQKVLKSEHPVLVAFLTPWSQACHIMEKVLDELTLDAIDPNTAIIRLNADDHPSLSLWYEIRQVPTLLLFMNGTVRTRIIGTISKTAVLAELTSIIHARKTAPHPLTGNRTE